MRDDRTTTKNYPKGKNILRASAVKVVKTVRYEYKSFIRTKLASQEVLLELSISSLNDRKKTKKSWKKF